MDIRMAATKIEPALKNVIVGLQTSLDQWTESQMQFLDMSKERDAPNLARAIANVVVEGDGFRPDEDSPLAAALSRLAKEAAAHDRRCDEQQLRNKNLMVQPSEAFLAAIKGVLRAYYEETREAPDYVKPLAQWLKEGAYPAAICSYFGWKDSSGRCETWKIDEEVAEPGKHSTKCTGWTLRHDRRRFKDHDAKVARVEALCERLDAKVAAWNRPKKSIERMLNEGTNLEQICIVHSMKPDAVAAYCREKELDVPKAAGTLAAMAGLYDRESPEVATAASVMGNRAVGSVEEEEHDRPVASIDGLSEDRKIITLHQGGNTAKRIAGRLGIDPKRVKAVLDRYAEEPVEE